MPDYRTMYDRDYIGHFDLPVGKDLSLTIKRVVGGELTAMGGRKSKKPIVHFREEGVKPLICNKTNSKTIAAMYGNMTEQWAGKLITLFISTTRSPDGSGEVECIRIRPKIPSHATARPHVAAEPPPLSDDTEAAAVAPKAAAAQPPQESPGPPSEAPTASAAAPDATKGGGYAFYYPGTEAPQDQAETADEWFLLWQHLCDKIVASNRMDSAEKDMKIRDLRKANDAVVKRLGAVMVAKLNADIAKRSRELKEAAMGGQP